MIDKLMVILVILCISCHAKGTVASTAEGGSIEKAVALSFEEWINKRFGLIHAHGQDYDIDDLVSYSKDIGLNVTKLFIASDDDYDFVSIISQNDYKKTIEAFDVLNIDLYFPRKWHNKSNDAKKVSGRKAYFEFIEETTKQSFYELTDYLIRNYGDTSKVFLLTYSSELNVWFNSRNKPEFPVDVYVNSGHSGIVKARSENDLGELKILDVVEVQCAIEFEGFIKRWGLKLDADLYALSYYCYDKDFRDQIDFIKKHTKPSSRFGSDNVLIGEFGLPIDAANYNEFVQLKWTIEFLEQAYEYGCPYAFQYAFLEQKNSIRKADGRKFGLVGLPPESNKRIMYDYLKEFLSKGREPAIGKYKAKERKEENVFPEVDSQIDLVVTNIEIIPKTAKIGEKVSVVVTVKNIGDKDSPSHSELQKGGIIVKFFVDDVYFGWNMNHKGLEAGKSCKIASERNDKEYFWKVRNGKHEITATVDPSNVVGEYNEKNNSHTVTVGATNQS